VADNEDYELPIEDWQTDMIKKMAHLHQHTTEKIRTEILGREFTNTGI
jgi:hypothetical protein